MKTDTEKLASLVEFHRSLENRTMPSAELWRLYDRHFKATLAKPPSLTPWLCPSCGPLVDDEVTIVGKCCHCGQFVDRVG